MRYFSFLHKTYHGIFDYLVHTLNYIPEIKANCQITHDPIEYLFTKPLISRVECDIDESEEDIEYSYFTIHLEHHKIIPIAYQFSTCVNTSPPVNWSISASTSAHDKWYVLDTKYNESTCSKSTVENSEFRCGDVVVNTFQIQNNILLGPFKFIKFTLFKNRYPASSDLFDQFIRLSGFELYGSIYKDTESIFIKCTQLIPNFHFYLILFSSFIF